MAAKVYAVLLHVPENHLGTVLSALSGSSTLVSVSPTVESAQPERAAKNFHFAHGVRLKGISGENLALEILSSEQRVFGITEINNKFVERGFARTSASPCLHKLGRDKKIRVLGASRYCALGVTLSL